jgi:hypothetical protein
MLLILAAATQSLLLCELLLRRILYLFFSARRTAVQRYADNSVLASLATAALQTATVPLQAAASLLASGTRVWVLMLLLAVVFTTMSVMSNASAYAFSAIVRMYNAGVAPAVGGLRWLSILLDFLFRAAVPLWNGAAYLLSQILRRLILPYSFTHVDTLPELLQGLALALGTLGQSVVTWLGHVRSCTLQYEDAMRVCGGDFNVTSGADCETVFTPLDSRCHAAPTHLALDLLTPGLFMRQAALSLQGMVASSCGAAAVVLNLALYPLCDHHIYAAVHAGVNAAVFAVVGLPISTWRRCNALEQRVRESPSALQPVHVKVGCSPDWRPLAAMAESALESLGKGIDNWLNAAAVLVAERTFGKAHTCEKNVKLKQIVLDAARAIEGLESVEALERLQGRGGLPESETLRSVRVVGLTPTLFGVTDGKSVLYRSAHDGYVLAYGAWPLRVDVRFGLAAVTYGGSATEADSSGVARTGLLGCRCVDEPELALLCSTAPYVQHIDDDLAGLNASSLHRVSFPDISLRGLTCANTAVRVMPLRWSRRRLATTDGGGRGFSGYDRFSFSETVRRYTGDGDATDRLQLLAARERVLPTGAVEAAIYVQPVCGNEKTIACAVEERSNCFPWCMGVVRGGRRAQNITMYTARRWEDHVVLPDVDCGVERASGTCQEASRVPLVDIMTQAGVVRGRCAASCVPAPVPAAVMSLVPLDDIETDGNSTLRLVQQHKQAWTAARLQQPVVVAGDVMLAAATDAAGTERLVVTRLFDIGQSTLQMASERLTLASNAHAAEITQCPTPDDTTCVAREMQAGRVVLPPGVQRIAASVADAGVVVPAAASRWAVHWAQNPDVAVYNTLFEFCRNNTPSFSFVVHSSYSRARVWTVQTMRAVDLEQQGAPSEAQTRTRVSFMRIPDFLDRRDFNDRACDRVVGLQVVGVEYLNEQNVLVTVLAARPRHYDPLTGSVDGMRSHRYYYLHPGRSDCVRSDDEDALPENPRIFSCWRSHVSGMWPADDLITGGVWSGESRVTGGRCTLQRVVPQFGTFVVMPAVAIVRVAETALDAVCTLTAVVAADPNNPARALESLFTVQLQQSTFHTTVDSAGARLLNVDGIIQVAEWLSAFNARLVSLLVNALTSVSVDENTVDKAVQGVRTLVVASAKVYEGMPATDAPFSAVEKMFREPIAYSGLHASVAVLTMADGLKDGVVMPAIVRAFMAAQLQIVSVFSLVLRIGRVVLLRLVQTVGAAAEGRQAAASSIVSAALLESHSIVENDYLGIMRFQCYGFAQMVGSERPWGQALRHMCLVLPDTLEGLLTIGTVLVLDYPVVSCACKLAEGDALGSPQETVVTVCLQRPMPADSRQWLLALRWDTASRQDVCFAAMDNANARLQTAFDKTFKRLYQMTRHAAQVADGLLALVTGDSVACDAFDVSPYVLSIIPEPVDYFASCVDTDDCAVRCLDEYSAFAKERQAREQEMPLATLGFETTLEVPLESLLFSIDDVEQGRHKPPFQILDAVELPRRACDVVCGVAASSYGKGGSNRCLLVAGVRGQQRSDLAVAYYCLPIDITQYVFQWPGMEAITLPAAGAAGGFAQLLGTVRAVFAATTWAARLNGRDSVIAVVDTEDLSAPDRNFRDAPARVTKVFWCVPGLPARELFRTLMLSERRLDATQNDILRTKAYMYAIEHVQVDVADAEDMAFKVRAYGFRMDVTTTSGQLQWSAPTAACIECSLASNPRLFTEASCQECEPVADFVQQHVRVCLHQDAQGETAEPCTEVLMLPTQRGDTGGFVSQAPETRATLLAAGASKQLRVPASTLSVLQNDARNGVYMDLQRQAHARVSIVSGVVYPSTSSMQSLRDLAVNSSGPAVELEVITVNAQRSQGAWIHMLSLRVDALSINGAARNWMRATTQARVHFNCSVRNCGACARTTDGEEALGSLRALENLCYAAQQCGVERCAGTLVNMRKPLCNLGSVLASDLSAVRVLLQGLWGAIADNIVMIVELTHQRRQEYQIKWPEKLVRQEACTAKDTIVSVAATLTSVLGAFSHLMQDVSLHHGVVGANVDSRVHARYIMVLTATTNMLASVFMWPVYQGLVLQKFFACTANDVLLNIDSLVGSGGTPQVSVRFGDPRAALAIESAGIAVCLSEDVSQSLQEAGVRVRNAGADGDAAALRVVRKISDAVSSSIDVGLSAYVQYAYHVMDVWLTWGASVLKGMMDVAQTIDWENCKLPVVDNGVQSLGMCACGDKEHAIQPAEKRKRWTEQAFWCSGLLMLNEGDGSDLVVWNPYSLEQLLAIQGKRGNGYNDYVICLRERGNSASKNYGSTCEEMKPRDQRLDRQGVDVPQVVSRCRANYQQSRWDEASALIGLFDASEWENMRGLAYSSSARRDDKYALLRKKVVRLLENDADLRSEHTLRLAPGVLQCLQDELRAGNLQHSCHRHVATFAYEPVSSPSPVQVDACQVLSGESKVLEFPRFLWSGNSRNHVPLAKLHPLVQTDAERVKAAEDDLVRLLADIEAEFDTLLNTSFALELKQSVRVESFSVEGDELHQLVDCVVMGPYSAADLSSNLHLDNVERVPVPQYHRGRPDSREFTSWGETGGSIARKSLMRNVFAFVNAHADGILMREVGRQLGARAQEWLDADNFKCLCNNLERGYQCCADNENFVLQRLPQEMFDLQDGILTETFQHVVNSKFLQETLWTQHTGPSVPLQPMHRAALQDAQLFAAAGHVPVRTYGVEDTAAALNEASLWESCTGRVAGLFSTLPLTEAAVNLERGHKARESTVHAPPTFAAFDPSVAYADDRVHSMELLVDTLLGRARALVPHFWTHAHRYVPSDSVWCEHADTAEPLPPKATKTPSSIKHQQMRQESILAPGVDEILYPADVFKVCACGWERDGLCYVPEDVCAHANSSLAGLEDSATRLWTTLCAGATYLRSEKSSLLLVLSVLPLLDEHILAPCSARRVSVAWGLLSPAQQDAWYAGARQNWSVDAQHIATAGPSGMRLGMLSPEAAESLESYVQRFALGETLRDTFNARYAHTIAQPVCSGNLHEYLTDDLRRYFADVFVPMAHSVQIIPAIEYCGRWALEHALFYVLQKIAQTPQHALDAQRSAAGLWRARCAAHMHEVGLCALRGVYDIVPEAADAPQSKEPASHCAFAGPGHSVIGCRSHYYTSGCLLFCDGFFYDPCLCGDTGACAPRPFTPEHCAEGRLDDGRSLLNGDEVLMTSSLTWPADVAPHEARNATHWDALRAALEQAKRVSKLADVDFDSIFEASSRVLLKRTDEETEPTGYCDDLFDYWPDMQHPVGYHPSTACSADATRTRGFDAWMSRDAKGSTLLDPVRMRNMTLASQVFGAAHLVCDAHVYAAPGHRLNPFYMQSRWDSQAHADPAMPAPAPAQNVDEMPTLGVPSYSDTDTPLRVQGHTADALLQHSVGLVRAWVQWIPANTTAEETAAAAAAQHLLDASWPHWLPDEERRGFLLEHAGLFLGAPAATASTPLGCSFPRLLRCRHSAECAPGAECLHNMNEEVNTRRGICMPAGKCYQHAHCPAGTMCSGEGACVEPKIFVLNEAKWDSEIQLFGRTGCDVSMQRLSRFESVADFARANGMCSFRDWYHYKNTTAGVTMSMPHVLSVQDRLVLRTDRAEAESIERLAVLKTLSHACDRSYAHTDFAACFFDAQASRVDSDSHFAAQAVEAARTWKLRDGVWHARFCALQGARPVTGFLSPYDASTLHSAARDVTRCTKLGLCPKTSFHVRGQQVEARRVRVHVLSEDSPSNVRPKDAARDYCGLDAQRCWGMGFLLGDDCAEVDKELSALCVVDELVLPLLVVAYGNAPLRTQAQFESTLAMLQGHCRRAFAQSFNGRVGWKLFQHVYDYLTQPYAWTDSARRQLVLEYANGLFWFVFGVLDERGITDVDHYLEHSRCATFVSRGLAKHEASFSQGTRFYHSSRTDGPLQAQRPVLPGASLYLIERRLPVSISLRWLLQCVVLAKDASEGGVMPSFLVELNRGTLAARQDTVDCANYRHDAQELSMPLSSWLRKAKFLFTQLESPDLNPLQVSRDVFASIGRAVAQLPVLSMPDLLCVASDEAWATRTGQTVFAIPNALTRLERFRNPALSFDVGAAQTVVQNTNSMFTDAGSTSIHARVLRFLVQGTKLSASQWTENTLMTLKQLAEEGVLTDMHVFNEKVKPTHMYPRYVYSNLKKLLPQLYDNITNFKPTLDSYTLADETKSCECVRDKEQAFCDHRRLLREPEYSLSAKVLCAGLRELPCSAAGVLRLLDGRSTMNTPFLTQDELLYLVLLIFEYEISYTASGGFTTLHRIKDPNEAQFVDDLFAVPLPLNASSLILHESRQFNEFLEQHDSTSMKCPPTELDFFQETNLRHQQLRQCRNSLREKIGWSLPSMHVLELHPARATLLSGFYLTHLQRPKDTFLGKLFDTPWTDAAHTTYATAICNMRAQEPSVMSPFWGEYFDVASDDSVDEPSLACDLEPSSAQSILMVYDTLCSSSETSPNARTCSDHPLYKDHLAKSMPAACARQDGRVVVRRHLGALKKEHGMLCDQAPQDIGGPAAQPPACLLKHGALNSHTGEHVPDLDRVSPVDSKSTQHGFWDPANDVFRGRQPTPGVFASIALNDDDIAGHCLGFAVNEHGTLALRSAALRTNCEASSAALAATDVRAWLADVEQEWAWDHAHAEAVHASNEAQDAASSVAWTCPLHWLQQYHDDDGRHQARSPSWQRNAARFAHITGAHQYAHPTVRHANRLRGLRAARFLGDGLACVAAAEDCHGAAFLNSSIADLLQPAWRPVAYVPADHAECPRVLDWPADCGKARPDGKLQEPGECVLRN